MNRGIGWLGLCCLVAACAAPPDRLDLTPATYSQLPGWQEDAHAEALQTLRISCEAFVKKPGAQLHGQGVLAAPGELWKNLCASAQSPVLQDDKSARQFFESWFAPYQASNRGKREGLFTGYYEPTLRGSLTRTELYRFPVYSLPPDLNSEPYYTRAQIDAGALANKGLEIAWVEDPVALFFLQIQGSGRIELDNGELVRIGYAGKNNQPYVAIGKVLVERGELTKESASLFTIRQWLKDHPDEAQALMEQNPSYVFFRINEQEDPLGAQGVGLTPERSIAIDPRFIPYGMPVFLDTVLPFSEMIPYRRLMIAQDTGGAIRGPVRADIFFGRGARAEWLAGNMKQRGTYTLLIPKVMAAQLGQKNR